VQVEISPVTQLEAENLVISATEDPSSYILYPRSAHEPASTPDRSRVVENKRSHSKCLRIEDHEFFLVSATTKAIQLLCEYIKLVFNLEGLATDVMTKMVEFLKVGI
jgi:vacuolar protein sorting-associated protein 54